ncbi:MAG: biopolymer transporter ExbD [Victivallales bacterium]|nr:biopolymer transporter ExbD [Victivallales bacterium]
MKRKKAENLSVQMSSMIDIVFLLLIYFIVTAREEITEAHLSVNLPAPGAAKATENKPKMLEIEVHQGQYRLNGAPLETDVIESMLMGLGRTDPSMTVMVKVAFDAYASELVTALDLCDKAGLTNLNVVSLR